MTLGLLKSKVCLFFCLSSGTQVHELTIKQEFYEDFEFINPTKMDPKTYGMMEWVHDFVRHPH